MKEELKLLQGNYCCMKENKMLYVTETNGVFVEIDLSMGDATIIEKEVLKNRITYITTVEDVIYAVDLGGEWIAETATDAAEIIYYPIQCHKGASDNFAYICLYDKKIFLFMKTDSEVVVFDTQTKGIEKKAYKLDKGDANFSFDTGCMHKNRVLLFSSALRKYIVYDLKEEGAIEENTTPNIGKVSYAINVEDTVYVLSGNNVHDVYKAFSKVAIIESDVFCSKICVANNIIWFLPGAGNNIYTYSLILGECKIFDEYPEDYEYDIKEGWGKFIGSCEDDKNIYWCMRANNYILKISKQSGNAEWIKPININFSVLKGKSYFENKKIVYEGNCTLEEYIHYIVR